MNRSLLISSVFSVVALALPASASANSNATASDGVQRVAIEGFRGPQAQRIQGAVETGLVGKYYVVPDFSVEEVARRKGVGLVLDDGVRRGGQGAGRAGLRVGADPAEARLDGRCACW